MARARITVLGISLGAVLQGHAGATPNPDLAVAIRRGVSRTVLASSRGFVLRDLVRDTLVVKWNKPDALVFEAGVEGIRAGDLGTFSRLSVEPLVHSVVSVDGNRYRGRLRVEEDSFGRINVVNLVDVESYLKGVIPAEMLVSSHMEALKAQAVVARTFALKEALRSRRTNGYDLTADTASQVYQGMSGEDPRASQAVEETLGSVIHVNNKLVDAFYHQACGGRTQNNEDVWGGAPLPHLKAVDCQYCVAQYSRQGYGDYHWSHRLTYTDLRVKLLEAGIQVGEILDLKQSLEECGRARSFTVSSSDGEIDLSSARLRDIIGNGVMKSSFYRLASSDASRLLAEAALPGDPLAEANIRSIIGGYLGGGRQRILETEGTGSGHGVGLCQWGARRQAEEGRSHEDILHYYYQSISVGPLLPEYTGD